MDRRSQSEKARRFRRLHHEPELLVLPNVWDPLGARLVASMGFPAVATASAAVSFSHGWDDGQRLRFDVVVEVIRRISDAVDLPVTADIEAGYARDPKALAANIDRVIEAGAVGINLEDTDHETGELYPTEEQCDRLRAAREAANARGVPLVINARTDVFLARGGGGREARLWETVRRGQAYADADADCFYPITVGDLDTLGVILREVGLPINVYAGPDTAPLRALEAAGLHRLSTGPGLMRASITAMRDAVNDLIAHEGYERFTTRAVSSDEIRKIVRRERMPPTD